MSKRADDPTRGHLVVNCPRGVNGACRFGLWQRAPAGITWQWDGNVESPTINPSVHCQQQGCGLHIVIGKGSAAGSAP